MSGQKHRVRTRLRLVGMAAAAMVACLPAPVCAQAPTAPASAVDSLTPEEQQRRRAKLVLDKLIGQIRDAYIAGQYQQVLDLVDEAEKTDPQNKTIQMYREWARERLLAGETGPPRPRFASPPHDQQPTTFPVAPPVAVATPAPAAPSPAPTPAPSPTPSPAVATSEGRDSALLTYILAAILGVVVIVGGALFAYVKLAGKRKPAEPLPVPFAKPDDAEEEAESAPSAPQMPAASPLAAASPVGAPASPPSATGGLTSPLTQPQAGGVLFGSGLSTPLFGTPTAVEPVNAEPEPAVAAPAAAAAAAKVFPADAPAVAAPEVQQPPKTPDTISFDLPPILPEDSPAQPVGRPTAPAAERRASDTISFGSLGLVESGSDVVSPPPPVTTDEVKPAIPPAPSIATISLDDVSALVPHRPEDKPVPPKPATAPAAPLALDDVAAPPPAGAGVVAPPAVGSPAMISLDDLMASPTTPVEVVSEQDETETKIPAAPPPPVATIQLSDDTRLPFSVKAGEKTLHGQETIRLAPSELPPPPTREAVVRMDDALSETKSLAGSGPVAANDSTATASPAPGGAGTARADNRTPSPDVGSFYVSTKPGDKNVDERGERMFRDQCARAKEAMAKKNYKQAVHYLSIAAAIHPEDEEVRRLLREAREAKRKQEAGA